MDLYHSTSVAVYVHKSGDLQFNANYAFHSREPRISCDKSVPAQALAFSER